VLALIWGGTTIEGFIFMIFLLSEMFGFDDIRIHPTRLQNRLQKIKGGLKNQPILGLIRSFCEISGVMAWFYTSNFQVQAIKLR
jgi:hypothetical protein